MKGVKPGHCTLRHLTGLWGTVAWLLAPVAALAQFSNSPVIDVRQKMRPAMLISPLSLDFGFVPRGETRTGEFRVQNVGGGWLVGRLVVTGAFQVVSGGNYRLGPNETQAIKIAFRPSGTPGDHQVAQFTGGGGFKAFLNGNLKLATSNSADRPTAAGAERGSDAPPVLAVSPGVLDFGLVPAGEIRTNHFQIANEGGGRLEGKATVLDPRQGLAVAGKGPFQIVAGGTYSLASGASQKVTITYHPGRTAREAAIIQFTGGGGANLAVSGGPGPARGASPAKAAP